MIVEISSVDQGYYEGVVPAISLGFTCTQVNIVHFARIISDWATEPYIAAVNIGKKGETNASS